MRAVSNKGGHWQRATPAGYHACCGAPARQIALCDSRSSGAQNSLHARLRIPREVPIGRGSGRDV